MANNVGKANLIALVDFLAECSLDPLLFAKTAFPWGEKGSLENESLDVWQLEILKELRDALKTTKDETKTISSVIRKAVSSGNGIGKSALVAIIILWALTTREDTKGVITANTDTQLKTKTWAELAKWYNMFIAKELFTYTATAIFSIDKDHEKVWRIDAIPWSDTNPEAFAGLHNAGKRILIVFDEASAISDKIWEVTEGALTDKNTQIVWLAFGNPTRNTGRFHDCFFRHRLLWDGKKIDSRNCKMSNKDQLTEWVNTYGEDSDFVKIHVRGLFPSISEQQFISTEIVNEARLRVARQDQVSFAPVIIGVDPAWTGKDDLVIYMRKGLYSKLLASFPKNDNDGEIAAALAGYEDEYNAAAVFIDQGYGTGIYSFGVTMGRKWRLVSFAGWSANPGYLNKRAEMWGNMKEWLKDGGAIENDDLLCSDLVGPEAFVTDKGKIQLESKDSMKRRGIPSPNRADALALTFAFPVAAKTLDSGKPQFALSGGSPIADYKNASNSNSGLSFSRPNNYNPLRR